MEFNSQLFDLIYERTSKTRDKVHFALTCKGACARYYFIALCEHLLAGKKLDLLMRASTSSLLLCEKERDDIVLLLSSHPDEAIEFARLFALNKCAEFVLPYDEILGSRAAGEFEYVKELDAQEFAIVGMQHDGRYVLKINWAGKKKINGVVQAVDMNWKINPRSTAILTQSREYRQRASSKMC